MGVNLKLKTEEICTTRTVSQKGLPSERNLLLPGRFRCWFSNFILKAFDLFLNFELVRFQKNCTTMGRTYAKCCETDDVADGEDINTELRNRPNNSTQQKSKPKQKLFYDR